MSPERRKTLTILACVLGSAVVFVDTTVINVALPSLRRDLDAGLAAQQWVVEAYLLTLAALLLAGGALGDLHGRRRVFSAGLAGFGIASLLCALAPSAELLVAARAVQGVGGALLVPNSLAILTSAFEGEERGRAVGSWTAWTGMAILVGPVLGGFLTEAVSWRLVFAINLPLVAAALLLSARVVEESSGRGADRGRDLGGAALAVLALGGPVLALIQQPNRGWGAPEVVGGLVVGLLALVLFVVHEKRTAKPMLPLGLFSSRTFSTANLVTLGAYAALGAMSFFLAIFLQQVCGYSALEAGLAQMPVTLIMFVLSRRAGGLVARLGARRMLVAGPLTIAAGLALTLRIDERGEYLITVLPAVVVFGLGLATTVAPLTATVLDAVPPRFAGVASGVNTAVARVAALLSIAAVGAVIAAQFAGALSGPAAARAGEVPALAGAREVPAAVAGEVESASVAGFHAGMAVAAGFALAAAAAAAFGFERRRGPLSAADLPDAPQATPTSAARYARSS